jgi:hypothetical protein
MMVGHEETLSSGGSQLVDDFKYLRRGRLTGVTVLLSASTVQAMPKSPTRAHTGWSCLDVAVQHHRLVLMMERHCTSPMAMLYPLPSGCSISLLLLLLKAATLQEMFGPSNTILHIILIYKQPLAELGAVLHPLMLQIPP